jgi:ABC-type dipeptide/oligopeptide/nickel transport system ATPase component
VTTLAAVRDLSFSIAPGEVLGLVGESGSGKSVTALSVMGLLPPSASVRGDIIFRNGAGNPTNLTTIDGEQLRHLRGARMAMIFQEPMTALNPVMRVGDQIAEAVLAHHQEPWMAFATSPSPSPINALAATRTSSPEGCGSVS